MIIIFILFILITYIVLVASCITKIIIIILFFLSYLLIFLFIFAAKRIKDKESVNWKIFFAYWRKTKIILFKIKLSVTRIGWNHDICSIVPLNAQFRYSSYTKLHFKMAVILNDMLLLISGLPRHRVRSRMWKMKYPSGKSLRFVKSRSWCFTKRCG